MSQKLFVLIWILYCGSSFASAARVNSVAPVLNKILPSVVNLSVTKKTSPDQEGLIMDPGMQKFFEEFGQHFGFRFKSPEQEEKITHVLGSGVIIDAKNGYVVTNYHVVVNAEEISVTMNDNRVFNAKLLGVDKETDLAVIQIIDGSNLSECKFGDSSNLQVGDFVIAIGNPFGLSHTVTSGIISALERSIADSSSIGHLIQTDASINPGNSGGALINFEGELVGINASIFSTNRHTPGNIGIGFAIPANLVKLVSTQLITKGSFERGRLGIEVQNVTSDMIEAMDIPKNFITGGSIIVKIEPDSPAAKAGLKTGDIIISLDGNLIKDNFGLINLIAMKSIGDKVSIKFVRNKKIQETNVQIIKFAALEKASQEVQGVEQLKGVYFANITSEHKLYGKVEGVVISKMDPSSKLFKTGLINVGDIVLSINQENVRSITDVNNVVKKISKKSILLNIYNENGGSKFIVIK